MNFSLIVLIHILYIFPYTLPKINAKTLKTSWKQKIIIKTELNPRHKFTLHVHFQWKTADTILILKFQTLMQHKQNTSLQFDEHCLLWKDNVMSGTIKIYLPNIHLVDLSKTFRVFEENS